MTAHRKHGCNNRPPMREVMFVQDGWSASGHKLTKAIQHVMSTDCRHDKRATDTGCDGCRWRNAVAN